MHPVHYVFMAFAVLVAPVWADERLMHGGTHVLNGVDGSQVNVSIDTAVKASTAKVEVCASNPITSRLATGVSVGTQDPLQVFPGATGCFSVAPVSQIFVLWAFSALQQPIRSIALRLDLTQSAGHILLFEWKEGRQSE